MLKIDFEGDGKCNVSFEKLELVGPEFCAFKGPLIPRVLDWISTRKETINLWAGNDGEFWTIETKVNEIDFFDEK